MHELNFPTLLFLLFAAHALADYPLQGDFLAQAKNKHTEIGRGIWPHALFAHVMIHGGFVLLLTGSIWLALAEVAIHAVTDSMKCDRIIGFHTDQFIHLACKIGWALIATGGQP